MRLVLVALLGVCGWGLVPPAVAAPPAKAESALVGSNDLARIAGAARRLSYSGTFIYQQGGGNPETSRVSHVLEGGVERERLEVLDGSPREVVRSNGEVRCYLPDQRMVIVEHQGGQSFLPVKLPESLALLQENYHLQRGGIERVAGRNSQLYLLEPRDKLRYGHMLWADMETGLLLKARMVGLKGETVEQFAFTQIQIGGAIDKEALRSRLTAAAAGWEVRNSPTSDTQINDAPWVVRNPVPGFRRTAGVKRHLRNEEAETLQLVYSDGMVAISVFIEPLRPKEALPVGGVFSAGATQFYKRVVGNTLLTVLGEVPPQTLMRLGDGMEPARH